MFKFNRVRWLHLSKIALFFIQLLYVCLVFTTFIGAVLYPAIPTNGLTYTLGGYTSSVVKNMIIENFKLDNFYIAMLTLISLFYVSFMILAIINKHWFKFDSYKYKKIMYLNMVVYTGLLVLCFLFILATPNISVIDFNQWMQQPNVRYLLNISYIITITNKNIEYSLSNEGIIIITIYVILLFICIIVLLLIIKKVIDHKFF